MNARQFKRYAFTRYVAAALIALAMVGGAQSASAQGAPPPTAARQPSPGALLLAKQIVEIKNVKGVFQPMIVGVVQKTRDAVMQTNFMWSKDINEIAANLQKQYEPRVTELVDATAKIYATHFTEQELKDLLTFYQSPLGQKMLTEEPKVLDESMVNAGNWADNLAIDVMSSMRAEMKKRGHDM
jgi:uncharacterized protein